jgi:hypothetical protein
LAVSLRGRPHPGRRSWLVARTITDLPREVPSVLHRNCIKFKAQ